MKSVYIALILFFASLGAHAEWTYVTSSGVADIYVDKATIRRSGNLVKMWNLADFYMAQGGEGTSIVTHLSYKDQSEFDCKEERQRTLYFTNHAEHMGAGTITYIGPTLSWDPISPDSVTKILWKIACAKK